MKGILVIWAFLVGGASHAADFTFGLRAGLPVNPIPAAGVEMGLSFGPLSLGLSYLQGSLDLMDYVDDDNSDTTIHEVTGFTKLSTFEMRYVLFWGLNVSLGVGQRSVGLGYEIIENSSGGGLAGTIWAHSYVVSHSVGAEWHFDWWYLRIDGVGHAYPLLTSTESELRTIGTLDGNLAEANEQMEDIAYDMGHVITKQLFLLSLGISI